MHKGSFLANLNDINVFLMPKKENACCMKDLRLIALCNVLYKILAKVLAKESAFIPGRSIIDNVLVAFEVVHYREKNNRGGVGEIALKLDIGKAYDRVDCAYFKSCMQGMGFVENGWGRS